MSTPMRSATARALGHGLLRERQLQVERRPLARTSAVRGDCTAMRLERQLRVVEAETDPGEAPSGPQAAVLAEESRDLGRVDADPMVDDAHAREPVLCSQNDLDPLSRFGELERVLDHVEKRATDDIRVFLDDDR